MVNEGNGANSNKVQKHKVNKSNPKTNKSIHIVHWLGLEG
jgi:hypothetical protein